MTAQSHRVPAIAFVMLLVIQGTVLSHGMSAKNAPKDPHKVDALAWERSVAGRHYYLKIRDRGLLMNDEVEVSRCHIYYSPSFNLATQESYPAFEARLWLQSVPPAPPLEIRRAVSAFTNLDDFDDKMSIIYSATPLEDAYEWPADIKFAVRHRYVALGMSREMVALALGGLEYQIDLEKLDDSRVRETWKLQVAGETRRIFSTRSTYRSTTSSGSSEASGNMTSRLTTLSPHTATASGELSLTGASHGTSITVGTESGFYVFSGLPPQFLNIVFTDGRVTARRTEFVK